MTNREHTIEIEELVLTGNPGQASIEAAVLRALREAGGGDALGQSNAEAPVAREITRAAAHAVQGRGA